MYVCSNTGYFCQGLKKRSEETSRLSLEMCLSNIMMFILISQEPQLQFAQVLKVQLPSRIQTPSFFHVTDSFWPHLLGAHVSNMFRYNPALACFLSGFSFPLFHGFYLYFDSLPFSPPTWFKRGTCMLNMCIQTKYGSLGLNSFSTSLHISSNSKNII